jgi:ABC-2 type transport system permease protein
MPAVFRQGVKGAAEISKSGFYELDYLGWCVLLFALFLVLSYRVFLKKDIQFRS